MVRTGNRHSYYERVWGFDPEARRVKLEEHFPCFKYEEGFPLARDPGLHRAGVRILARVVFGYFDGTPTKNAWIVFRRGEEEAKVYCTHTAVYSGSLEELPPELAEYGGVESGRSTERDPVDLPPEEMFVALRSYVAGVAEMGVANVMAASYMSEDVNPLTLPFGFNALMQAQVLKALRTLAPEVTNGMVREHVLRVLESVPLGWVVERWEKLSATYRIGEAFADAPEELELVTGVLGPLASETIVPDVVVTLYNRGNALRRAGEPRGAARAYRRVLELRPGLADVLVNLGACLTDSGDLDGALRAYGEVARLRPLWGPAWANLGVVYKLRGDLERALESTLKATEVEPGNGLMWIDLGAVQKARGDLPAAVAAARRAGALARAAGNESLEGLASYNLACYLALGGDLDGASGALGCAIGLVPECKELARRDPDLARLVVVDGARGNSFLKK
ncbi:MAG: tetratricopeptide repeat protein [Promethearchaeota archaeon]